MKKLMVGLLAFSFTILMFPVMAQTDTLGQHETGTIYLMVEEQPRFPGGEQALNRFLAQQIRYPAKAQHEKIEGQVVLQFIVNEKGHISEITVLKPLAGGLTEEAIRVVKAMPSWIPAKQNGKPVKSNYTLPIRFAFR